MTSQSRRRTRAATAALAGLGVAGAVFGIAGAGHPQILPTASASDAAVTTSVEAAPPAPPVSQEVIAQQAAAAGAAIFEAIRPHAVLPVAGPLTSGFGQRWGTLHAGIDFGDPIGAPIHSVTDGVVIEAGPASGFGLWVRVAQDDGTIGVYGHVNEILAAVGQQVRAGDVIATVGNRGFSTGPHLHYEVWLPGNIKVDPLPWLAARGVAVPGTTHS